MGALATAAITSAASTVMPAQAGDSDIDALLAAVTVLAEQGLIAPDVTPDFYHLA